MTCQILFENSCWTSICVRYSDVLKGFFTTTSVLQKYLDDHKEVEWLARFGNVKEFAKRIIGAEAPLTIIDGKWNDGGWLEEDDFFKDKIVKEIPLVNLNWNWR